ncbi:HNH endonuclease [Neobacillus niacini]|uniref:HNH endonuclease n=1 Tax=Neobacillus niacini TaxID=86668 RepID=UPI0005EED96D|nr:HNH endonuclease [Neobacillus niacini]
MPRTKICSNCNKRILQKEVCKCKKAWNKTVSNEKNQQYADEKKFFNSIRWKKLRWGILDRDEGVCMRCLIKFNLIKTSTLEAHHIKSRKNYPELRWDESNLVTLCKSCNTELGTNDKLDFAFEPKEIEYEYHL